MADLDEKQIFYLLSLMLGRQSDLEHDVKIETDAEIAQQIRDEISVIDEISSILG